MMSEEEQPILRNRNWADATGILRGNEPWSTRRRAAPPRKDAPWSPPVVSDVLQAVIAQALERIAQAESAAVIDTCTVIKAVVRISPHVELLTLMEQGRLVPVTVPCLVEELKNQLGRVCVGEGMIPGDRRDLALALMGEAVPIGLKRDKFRDAHAAFSLRGIVDRNDRAAVAAAFRARSLRIPLVTDDLPLREEASALLEQYGVAVMRTESFLDSLDQRKRE